MTHRPIIISIEGNIGAGKTTIVEKLQKHMSSDKNVVFLREPLDIWESIKDNTGDNILQKFYADPHRHGFAFQVVAYTTRICLLRKAIAENPDCDIIICERSLAADKHIFAKMLHDDGIIEPIHYQIYQKFCDEFSDDFGIDGIVYIDADADVCHERVSKRSRQGEGGIKIDYLQKCKKYHDDWLLANNSEIPPMLRIDANCDVKYDVTNPVDKGVVWLDQIVGFIWENYLLYSNSSSVYIDENYEISSMHA